MNDFVIAIVSWSDKQAEVTSVHRAVFIEEQNVPESIELDGRDPQEWTKKEKSEEWPCCKITAGKASAEK